MGVEPPTPYIIHPCLTIEPEGIDTWREPTPGVLVYEGSSRGGLHANRGDTQGGMKTMACKMRWHVKQGGHVFQGV